MTKERLKTAGLYVAVFLLVISGVLFMRMQWIESFVTMICACTLGLICSDED
jgi:hypothetical protein